MLMYVYKYTDIHIGACMHIYFCIMCICTYIYTYAHVCLPSYTDMYACMSCVGMHIHIYIAAYIHI